MAAGALDGNGIWLYGEDDERDTFSELLNIGQDATSDAVGADRARLDALETVGTLGAATAAVATAASGWTLTDAYGRKKNGIAWVAIRVTRSGGTVTVSAGTGDITNQSIATLGAGWVAASGMQYIAGAGSVGRTASGYVSGSDVVLSAVAGDGTNIINTDTISFNLCYPLA